jgi:hypothetical protein
LCSEIGGVVIVAVIRLVERSQLHSSQCDCEADWRATRELGFGRRKRLIGAIGGVVLVVAIGGAVS